LPQQLGLIHRKRPFCPRIHAAISAQSRPTRNVATEFY